MQQAGCSKRTCIIQLATAHQACFTKRAFLFFFFFCEGGKVLKGMEYSECCNEMNKEVKGGVAIRKIPSPGRAQNAGGARRLITQKCLWGVEEVE